MAGKPSTGDVNHALRGLRGGPGNAVLIVEPNPDLQSRLARQVTVHGHRVIGTSSLDGAIALLKVFPVDLILLSEALLGTDADALRVVGDIVGRQPQARVVIMTAPSGSGSEPGNASRRTVSPRLSALEYVSRPFSSDALSVLLAG